MKKYFLGLSAVVCAIAFSAFTKPFATLNFKLLTDPVVANVVADPAQWSPSGSTFGDCGTISDKIACTISLNSARTLYYHNDGTKNILNTFTYANGQNPKQDYLEISEATSSGNGGADRIISAMPVAKHFNTVTQAYETVSLGSDLSFVNGFEAP